VSAATAPRNDGQQYGEPFSRGKGRDGTAAETWFFTKSYNCNPVRKMLWQTLPRCTKTDKKYQTFTLGFIKNDN
jgi:hypothetical protein